MSATTAALPMRQGVPDPAEQVCGEPLRGDSECTYRLEHFRLVRLARSMFTGFSVDCDPDRLTVETLFDPLWVFAPRAVWLRGEGDGQ
jgi:hypothetical protein